jgi:hypothetical protein
VGRAVYAIDGFPDGDLLWRIEWIGGVGYNMNVPSDRRLMLAWPSFLGGKEPAQRAITLLSNEEANGEDRGASVALPLDRFHLAEAAACSYQLVSASGPREH